MLLPDPLHWTDNSLEFCPETLNAGCHANFKLTVSVSIGLSMGAGEPIARIVLSCLPQGYAMTAAVSSEPDSDGVGFADRNQPPTHPPESGVKPASVNSGPGQTQLEGEGKDQEKSTGKRDLKKAGRVEANRMADDILTECARHLRDPSDEEVTRCLENGYAARIRVGRPWPQTEPSGLDPIQ